MRASFTHVVLTITPLVVIVAAPSARAQARDTLLSALKEPQRGGYAPLVPAAV